MVCLVKKSQSARLIYHSPSEFCTEFHCTKQCSAGGHFDWCIEHSALSSEDIHGTYCITEVRVTKIDRHITERRNVRSESALLVKNKRARIQGAISFSLVSVLPT